MFQRTSNELYVISIGSGQLLGFRNSDKSNIDRWSAYARSVYRFSFFFSFKIIDKASSGARLTESLNFLTPLYIRNAPYNASM